MMDTPTSFHDWLDAQPFGARVSDYFGNQPDLKDGDAKAAWAIYTQLRSRITTQPMRFIDGDDAAALKSVYELFKLVRETVAEYGPECQLTASVAFHMLNDDVRWFTAKWHKRNTDGELVNNDQRGAFRTDLREVKKRLGHYAQCFAWIAGDETFDTAPPEIIPDSDFQAPSDRPTRVKPEVWTTEQIHITAKRKKVFGNTLTVEQPLTGLALSGGGIRSATFAAGVTHKLAEMGLFRHVDYLSTVSGGGYLGAFINTQLESTERKDQNPYAKSTEDTQNTESPAIRHLRDHSKNLKKDLGRALSLWLYGFCVNILLFFSLATLLCSAFYAALYFFGAAQSATTFFSALIVLSVISGFGSIAVLSILFILSPFIAQDSKCERRVSSATKIFLRVLLGAFFIGCSAVVVEAVYNRAPSFPFVPEGWHFALSLLTSLILISLLLSLLAFLLPAQNRARKLLLASLGKLGWVAVLGTVYSTATLPPIIDNPLVTLAVSIAVFAWLMTLNINRTTLSQYYRNRLAETYLTPVGGRETPLDPLRPLAGEAKHPAPYHLINTAVNLASAKDTDLRGRKADFFLFSRLYCGSPELDYSLTSERYPELKLADAIAISGAAAAPLMGRHTSMALAPWLAILNVRLGYWLKSPSPDIKSDAKPRPTLLWKEIFGNTSKSDTFVNVSDGGHIENLGIYELLRRECSFIVAIDGEADPHMQFDGLVHLVRLAKIDFEIDIDINLSQLKPNEDGTVFSHFALASIHYPNGKRGLLLYIKSSLTGNESIYTTDYRRTHPDFPHETTADQFFSEAQFEAYRALGFHTGEDLFKDIFIEDEEADIKTKLTKRNGMCWFFEKLREQLLPDGHRVDG